MDDDQFDIPAGEAARDEAIERGARATDPYWAYCMLECAKQVARRKPYLSSDDIVRLRRERFPDASTGDNRHIGGVMREAQRLGYFEPVQETVPSAQKQCHRRPMRVWHSLIYEGNQPHRKPRKRRTNDPRQYEMF